jgi:hypothetical protein
MVNTTKRNKLLIQAAALMNLKKYAIEENKSNT